MEKQEPDIKADRATFSADPKIMKLAREKAKRHGWKFSTYVARLIEADVTGTAATAGGKPVDEETLNQLVAKAITLIADRMGADPDSEFVRSFTQPKLPKSKQNIPAPGAQKAG